MHQLDGCQKEGYNFLNLLQKEGNTQKGGVPSEKVPTLEETMANFDRKLYCPKILVASFSYCHYI